MEIGIIPVHVNYTLCSMRFSLAAQHMPICLILFVCFTLQWSFGVVCWEVFSLGKMPYPAIEHQDMLKYIESGKRLPKTTLCGDEM